MGEGGDAVAEQAVLAAELGDLAEAAVGGVAVAPLGLPGEGAGGALAGGLGGVGAQHLRQVAQPEHLLHRPELALLLRREVLRQEAVLRAPLPLVLARRARLPQPRRLSVAAASSSSSSSSVRLHYNLITTRGGMQEILIIINFCVRE